MSVDGMVNLPVGVEAIAQVLDRQRDYRVLRRVPPFFRSEPHCFSTATLAGVVLDVETTGLDYRTDHVIELAMQPFRADAQGRIVESRGMRAWLEDPRVPISDEITRVTRLRAEDLKGRAIPDGEAGAMLIGADLVISHNAAFDRPFVEARLPPGAGRPWACSLKDVGWAELGFEGRSQSQLVAGIGGFYDAHRASVDVNALLHLLDHVLPDGRSVLSRLVERASRTSYLIEVAGAPRDVSPRLKARGYRWDPGRLSWSIEVDADRREPEAEWATIHAYGARDTPAVTAFDWTRRYAADQG